MVIKLYQNVQSNTLISLRVELSEEPIVFSVEVQKGLINRYDENLNLTQIEVLDPELIKAVLSELESLLNDPTIKIIRKAA